MPAHGERIAGQGSASSGTGVIIDERGYIVTCHHVVAGADAVFVKLKDGRRFVAKAIRWDPFTDLAVLRIEDAGRLTVATLAPSDKLDVGDWVVSVGTPYGLTNSVSAGIVSAIDREIPEVPRTRLIQTDAASNPGNSGGALINLKGELIGITEGSYGASEAFQGITFAIPSDVVKDVVHKLIEHGEVRRAYLGCHTENLTPDIAGCVGLTSSQGVIVTNVAADAPAAQAGIRSGDVLLRFDEASIVDGKVMQELVEAAVPGRAYTLTMLRERKTVAVKVVLRQLPPIQGGTPDVMDTPPNSQVAAYVDNTLGLHLDELTPDARNWLGYDDDAQGVVVSKVVKHTPGYNEGICAGMVILRLGNCATGNLDEYKAAVDRLQTKANTLVLVGTPEGNRYMVMKPSRDQKLRPGR